MEKQVERLLRGGTFRHVMEYEIRSIREKYALKKIDIEILFYLAKHKGQDRGKDIQQYLFLNKGHISKAVEELCARGYLTASSDPEDRRYIHYHMTAAADDVVREINQIWQTMTTVIFEGITTEERAVLREVADKMEKNMERLIQQYK